MNLKKTLIYLSVLGFSSASFAQSSVSLSGVADAAITYGNGSLTNRSQLTSGGNSTSKLRFRGTENLGGGMSAMFWLEAGILLDTGAGQATNPNNQPPAAGATAGTQGLTYNRRAIVGLLGPWGAVHMGREWSPSYEAYTPKFDPFGVGIGIGINYTGSITFQNGAVRMSNDIAYITPKVLGGLFANIQHWFGENPSGTSTFRDGTGNGIRLSYENGPINSQVYWARTHYAAGDALYRGGAINYDFGPVKATAVVNSDRQGVLGAKGLLVGAWVPLGNSEIKAAYSMSRSNAAGEPEAKKIAVGYVYNLSKRTALYTTLAHVTNKGGSRQALGGSTTGPNQSSKGFDLGIRHDF
jgi:predicted porin